MHIYVPSVLAYTVSTRHYVHVHTVTVIIEYGSTLCVGMPRGENGDRVLYVYISFTLKR